MRPISPVDGLQADEISEASTERWNAASGYLVIALGIAGAAFERGSPPLTAPTEEVVAFWLTYQRELLAQSMMFVRHRSQVVDSKDGEMLERSTGTLGKRVWRRSPSNTETLGRVIHSTTYPRKMFLGVTS